MPALLNETRLHKEASCSSSDFIRKARNASFFGPAELRSCGEPDTTSMFVIAVQRDKPESATAATEQQISAMIISGTFLDI